ncbi:DUF6807 domain-containing protein [Cyclobacterium marinum]|uniref:DUF6807 domain-containing protein n=1 Tax=Cyclobacterium marinum TaxID=104 RepID=UPI0011EFE98B|nr:PmoA family protein [Cyclobacterium marinum]MBI0399836.1 PmoA family protein [Cyclobacterium marinum]
MKNIAFLIVCFTLFVQLSSLAQKIEANKIGDRIDVVIDGQFFTSYHFAENEKYPFFFPVNGPSGALVTSMRNGIYPHHSSLFLGCDRVNGGNYWQEGLDRGQIVSLRAEIEQEKENELTIFNECIWTRPGASAPIKDFRTIRISSTADGAYQIDFDITMEMLEDVIIEKTNHSLFSVRMDQDLNVVNGGTMINAEGDKGEKETFGKPSSWIDFYGNRGEVVEGLALMQHPSNDWYPSPWFTRDYGFISPTPMNWPEDEKGTQLKKGDAIHLKYRVIVHQGDHLEADIAGKFDAYSKNK